MANILIIDDEQGILDLLKEALELDDHTVFIAVNGKKGLVFSQTNRLDIVITDIFMPEQDGFETIMQLKRTAPAIKIIAISGGGYFASDNALRTAEHLGAHYAFNKPFNIQDLRTRVKMLLAE